MDSKYSNTETSHTFQVMSIAISSISIIYGLSRYTLRNMLGRDPQITENLFYAFTELSTSLTILISPLGYFMVCAHLHTLSRYYVIIIVICIVIVLWILPIIVSFCILSPKLEFQICMIIDYRIYFSFVCKHISSMNDLVRARRKILIVSMLYSLVITLPTGVVLLFAIKNPHNTNYIPVLVFSFSIISGIITLLELLIISCSENSFLNWVFLTSLTETTSVAVDHQLIKNETNDDNAITDYIAHQMNKAKDTQQSGEEIELLVIQQLENDKVIEDEMLPYNETIF